MIPKNTWVQIQKVVLKPEDRLPSIPEDTQKCPLTMWVKGFLLEDSELLSEVQIETITGRVVSGTLVQVEPAYHHDFGDFVPELLQIDKMVKSKLDGENHE